ncbi:hypothetical protein CLU79DRAFT_673810, partial [Phycomyces nitens]
ALTADTQIQKLLLSRLPALDEQELIDGIRGSLAIYGQILDVGLCREPKYNTFLGTGYAILQTSPPKHQEMEVSYEPLSHNIQWLNTDDGFRVLTSSLPVWCRYCHEDGHDRSNCPTRPTSQRACWLCHENGHTKANCPR